ETLRAARQEEAERRRREQRRAEHHVTHEENPGVAHDKSGEARASLDGDWSESYMLDLMEWHLQVQNRLPQLAGTAQWVFKDFGTPLRPENPIPYVNQKGLVDRSGAPKDLYYLFKAYQTAEPVCYIESPTWPLRSGEAGALKRIRVYSNCEAVELQVNGSSFGTKFPNPQISAAGGLVWFVPFQLGKNVIRALGAAASGAVIEHQVEQTLIPSGSGEPCYMRAEVKPIKRGHLIRDAVTIQLVDKAFLPVCGAERFIEFDLIGAGRLISHLGTPDGSRIIETANGAARITACDVNGESRLWVRSAGIADLMVPIVKARLQPLS
ncbi:MAG: DUF4982 domain-containing protein, partial [Chloroflexota bacterium]